MHKLLIFKANVWGKFLPTTPNWAETPMLNSQVREIIFNVYKLMKDEMLRGAFQNWKQVQKRVRQATGISERSLRNVLHHAKSIERGDIASSILPGQKEPRILKRLTLMSFINVLFNKRYKTFIKLSKTTYS